MRTGNIVQSYFCQQCNKLFIVQPTILPRDSQQSMYEYVARLRYTCGKVKLFLVIKCVCLVLRLTS